MQAFSSKQEFELKNVQLHAWMYLIRVAEMTGVSAVITPQVDTCCQYIAFSYRSATCWSLLACKTFRVMGNPMLWILVSLLILPLDYFYHYSFGTDV